MRAGIAAIDGVRVLGDGTFHCVRWPPTVPASTCSPSATRCAARGWHLDRQAPPDSLHATVSQGNAATMDAYLADLAAAVAAQGRTADRTPATRPSSSTSLGADHAGADR